MAGRRYLTSSEAAAALRRGSQIEQFLGRSNDNRRPTVRWLSAYPSGRAFELVVHHVEDIGTEGFFDVSEFPPLDDEEYVGEGRSVAAEVEPGLILDAAELHGARPDRWVNAGVVQDEYRDSRVT